MSEGDRWGGRQPSSTLSDIQISVLARIGFRLTHQPRFRWVFHGEQTKENRNFLFSGAEHEALASISAVTGLCTETALLTIFCCGTNNATLVRQVLVRHLSRDI
jgi:hypothetical protein